MANKKDNRLFQKTHLALREAYFCLLEEKPSNKITIKDICERAELSRPAFYAHFTTKEAILLEYVEDFLAKIIRGAEDLPLYASHEDEFFVAQLFFQTWQDNSHVFKLLKATNMICSVQDSYQQKLQKSYEQFIVKLTGKNNVQAALYLSKYVVGGAFALLDSWMQQGMNRSVQEMAELSTSLISHEGFEREMKR